MELTPEQKNAGLKIELDAARATIARQADEIKITEYKAVVMARGYNEFVADVITRGLVLSGKVNAETDFSTAFNEFEKNSKHLNSKNTRMMGVGSQQAMMYVTQEQFNRMTYKEKKELANSNPELYQKLLKKRG